MSPIFRKLAGRIAVAVALVIEGALAAVAGIGMITAADDAQNLPRLVKWVLGTPWYIPAIVLPVLLLAFAAWVFQPDQIIANAMREYKASNDRAWDFEPVFQAEMDKLGEARAEIFAAMDELKIIQDSYVNGQHHFRERLQQDLQQQVDPVVRDRFNAQLNDLKLGREREFSDQIAALQTAMQMLTARLDAQLQLPQDAGSEATP